MLQIYIKTVSNPPFWIQYYVKVEDRKAFPLLCELYITETPFGWSFGF